MGVSVYFDDSVNPGIVLKEWLNFAQNESGLAFDAGLVPNIDLHKRTLTFAEGTMKSIKGFLDFLVERYSERFVACTRGDLSYKSARALTLLGMWENQRGGLPMSNEHIVRLARRFDELFESSRISGVLVHGGLHSGGHAAWVIVASKSPWVQLTLRMREDGHGWLVEERVGDVSPIERRLANVGLTFVSE